MKKHTPWIMTLIALALFSFGAWQTVGIFLVNDIFAGICYSVITGIIGFYLVLSAGFYISVSDERIALRQGYVCRGAEVASEGDKRSFASPFAVTVFDKDCIEELKITRATFFETDVTLIKKDGEQIDIVLLGYFRMKRIRSELLSFAGKEDKL